MKRRQGVRYPLQEGVTVIDPQTMQPVPRDGETMGEVMFRGNIVMKGYLKNEKATDGSLRRRLVPHRRPRRARRADGYVEHQGSLQGHHHLRRREHLVRSRSRNALPPPGRAVRRRGGEAGPKWGEAPCAFVELKHGASASEAEIIAFCREHIARLQDAEGVVFGPIPKTSTGKIQKFVLRNEVGSAKAITA